MPKGYNADGTKKVRPANSGRKAKEGKQIHGKLAIDVIKILASQANPVAFLENAVREKAHRANGQRINGPVVGTGGISKSIQVDLVDIISAVKEERKTVDSLESQP